MSTDDIRRLAYATAFEQLRAAAAGREEFDCALTRALDQLSEQFPDEVPIAVETLMAYAASLGQVSGKQLAGFV